MARAHASSWCDVTRPLRVSIKKGSTLSTVHFAVYWDLLLPAGCYDAAQDANSVSKRDISHPLLSKIGVLPGVKEVGIDAQLLPNHRGGLAAVEPV